MRHSQKNLRQLFAPSTFSVCICLFIVTVLCPASPLHASAQEQTESMRKSVFALDSARQTAFRELESTALSQGEIDDYKDFIVYLNTRILNYCMELTEQGGEAAAQGLPCPDVSATGNTEEVQEPAEQTYIYFPVTEPAETHTQAEKTASMDKQLFAALADFDELLLKEEEKVSARVPSQRESGSAGQNGTNGSGGSSGGTGTSGDGSGDQDGSGMTSADTGDSGSSAAEGENTAQPGTASGAQSSAGAGDANIDHSRYGAPGGKLPPPQDDDIVARQLREAAEKETDPELKKKLWEEYWKYKGVKKGE
jgi:uncharacterized membrane protein YgcG